MKTSVRGRAMPTLSPPHGIPREPCTAQGGRGGQELLSRAAPGQHEDLRCSSAGEQGIGHSANGARTSNPSRPFPKASTQKQQQNKRVLSKNRSWIPNGEIMRQFRTRDRFLARCRALREVQIRSGADRRIHCRSDFSNAAQPCAAMRSHAQPCAAMRSHAQPCAAMRSICIHFAMRWDRHSPPSALHASCCHAPCTSFSSWVP